MDNSVIVSDIGKCFGHGNHKVRALDGVSLQVKRGELFGLIGPDGAGKTTLFRIVASLMLPDCGHAEVEGFDTVAQYREIRKIIGYMPGRFSLYQDLSVEENLKFFATLFGSDIKKSYPGIQPIYRYLEPFKKRKAGKLSGGMKQKLALCCALIHDPKVLLLDEPTTGVDPVSRKEFWEMLGLLQDKGITVIASTPYMNEAMRCHRVCLLQNGKVVGCDSPENIRRAFPFKVLSVKSAEMFRLLEELRRYPGCHACYPFGAYHHFYCKQGSVQADTLQQFLENQGYTDIKIKESEPTIEDCFMDLMSQGGKDGN